MRPRTDGDDASPPIPRSIRVRAFLLGILAAVAVLGAELARPSYLAVGELTYETEYEGQIGSIPALMTMADGHSYARLARNVALRFDEPSGEDAYRASRPFVYHLVWVLSGGGGGATARGVAVLVSGVLALGFVAWVLASWRVPLLGLGALLLFPGAHASVLSGGAELWGLGFVLLALRLRGAAAVAAFAAAALCRETYVLAALWALVRGRREALGALSYLVWAGLVWLRTGFSPWGTGRGIGLLGGLDATWHRSEAAADALTLAWLAIAAVCCAIAWRSPLGALGLVFVAFAAALGSDVWGRWVDFGRVLVPVALGPAALLALRERRHGEEAPAPVSGAPPLTARP